MEAGGCWLCEVGDAIWFDEVLSFKGRSLDFIYTLHESEL